MTGERRRHCCVRPEYSDRSHQRQTGGLVSPQAGGNLVARLLYGRRMPLTKHGTSDNPSDTKNGMAEFLVQFPVRVLVEKTTVETSTGKVSVRGVMSVTAGEKVAVALFTDHDLAVRFARDRGLPDAQVGAFDDPIDFGYFLQEQKKGGFTHVCVDPQNLVSHSIMVQIDEVLTSLAVAIGRSKP
jgi:hypothetical protein